MYFLHLFSTAFVVYNPASTPALTPPVSAASNAQSHRQSLIPGMWTGNFFQRDWTFEIKSEGGKYTGRYRRSDGRSWLPLKELQVSGRKVSFSIESSPKVSFDLQGDTANQNLSGNVTLEGYATLPFSAARNS